MHNKKHRHERAMNLFAIEEREQELFATAFDATRGAVDTAHAQVPISGDLSSLIRDADVDILASHHRLRTARVRADRIAADDPELTRLNTLVNSMAIRSAQVDDIIDGEAAEVVP